MLIHTCFFFACLPVASHVWGRVGQGKEPSCTCSGQFPTVWLSPGFSPALARALPVGSGTAGEGHSQSHAGFEGAAVLWCLLVKLQTACSHSRRATGEEGAHLGRVSPSHPTLQSLSSSLAAVQHAAPSRQGCISACIKATKGAYVICKWSLRNRKKKGVASVSYCTLRLLLWTYMVIRGATSGEEST